MSPETTRPGLRQTLLALDIDGVLLDPMRGGLGRWQEAFSDHFGVDGARLDGALFAGSWADVIVGRRSIESALDEALCALGWEIEVEAALRCWFEADFVVDPDVVAAVRDWSAAGCAMALVSNQERRRARFLEARLARLLPLAGTAFSGDLGTVKDDPAFYRRAEEHLGLRRAASVVFLDDTPANVEVASRHGWQAVQFVPGGDWRHLVEAALDGTGP